MNLAIKIPLLISMVSLLGCATTTPPPELVNARQAYGAAEANATRAAPKELHAAKLALDSAEIAFERNPKSTDVTDRAYIAQRKAELAGARASIFIAGEQREASNFKLRALGAAAVGELRATKEDLSDARQKVRVADRDAQGLQTDLDASRSRAAGLTTELRVSESKAGDLTTRLADQTMARMQAEASLKATLQSMRDLQSVKEEPRGLVITLSGAVVFASGKAELLPAARSALDNVAEALKGTPNRSITVEGHTDAQGSMASNMTLSQARADEVRRYLVSRGIDAAMVTAQGEGPHRPVADNATAEGRANNRRVEIVLAPAPPEAR